MNDKTRDIPSALLPEDDEQIRQAFATVDERLSAWSDAVREVQTALVAMTAHGENVREDTGKPANVTWASAADAATPVICDSEQNPLPDADAAPSPPSVEAEQPASPEFDLTPPPVTPTEPLAGTSETQEWVVETSSDDSVPASAETVTESETAAPAGSPQPQMEDDEAVLASLDEQTAQKILIMRRLSPVKKSIRELLEEYKSNQHQAAHTAAKKKRTWWGR